MVCAMDALDRASFLASAGQFAEALAVSLQVTEGDASYRLRARLVAGWCLSRLGRNEEAFDLAHATWTDATSVLGDTDPVTLDAENDVARFASRCGRLDVALEYGQRVAETRIRVLGATHPKTLTSRSNLARYRWLAGRDGATVLLDDVLDAWRAVDPDGVDPAHLSARMLRAEMLTSMAAEESAAVRRDYAAVLGASHPDTLRAASVLPA